MPKLDLKEIKKSATIVFKTKKEMLNYISKSGFKDNERITIYRIGKKWILWWQY